MNQLAVLMMNFTTYDACSFAVTVPTVWKCETWHSPLMFHTNNKMCPKWIRGNDV